MLPRAAICEYNGGVMQNGGLKVQIRAFSEHDAAAVASLFYLTVHSVNAADYNEAQLNAWAPAEVLAEDWSHRFDGRLALVALYSGEVVGFADMDVPRAYLDRLYVHRDYQRCGIATALCNALETACPAGAVISVHASLTAEPFFVSRGYRVQTRQTVSCRGVLMDNCLMCKNKA